MNRRRPPRRRRQCHPRADESSMRLGCKHPLNHNPSGWCGFSSWDLRQDLFGKRGHQKTEDLLVLRDPTSILRVQSGLFFLLVVTFDLLAIRFLRNGWKECWRRLRGGLMNSESCTPLITESTWALHGDCYRSTSRSRESRERAQQTQRRKMGSRGMLWVISVRS
jgi:hypothetical protein